MYVGVLANTQCIFHCDGIVGTHGFLVPSFLFLLLFLLPIPGFPEAPGHPVLTGQPRRRRWCVQSGPCSAAGPVRVRLPFGASGTGDPRTCRGRALHVNWRNRTHRHRRWGTGPLLHGSALPFRGPRACCQGAALGLLPGDPARRQSAAPWGALPAGMQSR